MFTLPESVRWLLSQNRTDEAWKSLTWIRGDEGKATQEEFHETKAGIVAEESAKDNFTVRELWHPSNRLRFIVGPAMFIFQNTTGSSSMAVFAPQYFKLLIGSSGNRDLLLTGLFGVIKVIASTFFIWVLAEQLPRRTLLIGGAWLMATCMLILTLIVRFLPTENLGNVTNAGRATIAMVYLDIVVSIFISKQTKYITSKTKHQAYSTPDIQLLLGSCALGIRARDLPNAHSRPRIRVQYASSLGDIFLFLIRYSIHDRQHWRLHFPHFYGL